jgi:hypothetical protein
MLIAASTVPIQAESGPATFRSIYMDDKQHFSLLTGVAEMAGITVAGAARDPHPACHCSSPPENG